VRAGLNDIGHALPHAVCVEIDVHADFNQAYHIALAYDFCLHDEIRDEKEPLNRGDDLRDAEAHEPRQPKRRSSTLYYARYAR